jgi:hypothetical protein
MSRHNFPSDRPTRPDVNLLPCPNCRGEHNLPTGEVLITEDTGSTHISRPIPCPTCRGRKKISRVIYDQWAALSHSRR